MAFRVFSKTTEEGVQRRDDGRGNGIDGTEIVRRRSLDESVGVGAYGEKAFECRRRRSGKCCVATGSEISPVKSLLEEGFDDENTTKGRETHVFYGTRDKEHTAFAEELKNTLGGRVNIIHAYSARRKQCSKTILSEW